MALSSDTPKSMLQRLEAPELHRGDGPLGLAERSRHLPERQPHDEPQDQRFLLGTGQTLELTDQEAPGEGLPLEFHGGLGSLIERNQYRSPSPTAMFPDHVTREPETHRRHLQTLSPRPLSGIDRRPAPLSVSSGGRGFLRESGSFRHPASAISGGRLSGLRRPDLQEGTLGEDIAPPVPTTKDRCISPRQNPSRDRCT